MAGSRIFNKLCGCLGAPILTPIVMNELCERWSFYGMRAVLVLYLNDALLISEDDSVAIYSFFMAACYFAPLLGGFVSDTFLGKYRTIVLFNLFYITGLAVLTGSAFKTSVPGSYIGLLLIALGTGGIKPCVSAFGADQIADAEDRHKSRYWFLFYLSINVGSFLSYILTPIVRIEAGFPFAFLLSLVVLILSLIVFIVGDRKALCGGYRKVPPVGHSFYGRFAAVVSAACRARKGKEQEAGAALLPLPQGDGDSVPVVASSSAPAAQMSSPLPPPSLVRTAAGLPSQERAPLIRSDRSPDAIASGSAARPTTGMAFFDGALMSGTVSPRDVFGVAAVVRLLPLFLCISLFWAVFDSQGSLMTLERKVMRTICLGGGDKGCLTPEQLGVLNPFFVIILVPLMGFVLEAWMRCSSNAAPDSCRKRMEPTLLRRMTAGLFISGLAFALTAIVQRAIDNAEPFTISVLAQVPQILVLTVAEVLVSATGLEWAYSQAPPEYRSSVMALWQVTVALGNLLTGVLFGGLSSSLSSLQIILVLTGLVFVASIVFMVLAVRYKTLAIPAEFTGASSTSASAIVAGDEGDDGENEVVLAVAGKKGTVASIMNDTDEEGADAGGGAFAALALTETTERSGDILNNKEG